jgi:hypothetical protein
MDLSMIVTILNDRASQDRSWPIRIKADSLIYSCPCSCIHKIMKTITLDDEAYALLKLWKTSGRESFSMVVKRVVPVPGTLGCSTQLRGR